MSWFVKHASPLLVIPLIVAATAGGCGGASGERSQFDAGGGGGGGDATTDVDFGGGSGEGGGGPMFGGDGNLGSTSGGGDASFVLEVEPATVQTLTVSAGESASAMPYTATVGGVPVKAAWTVQQGNLGTIGAGPSSSATFVANGSAGGLVTIVLGYNGQTVTRQILIQLDAGTQNGPNTSAPGESAQVVTNASQLTAGGGVGGVGGEGLGAAVTDKTTLAAFQSPMSGAAQKLTVLYPYDGTVFPRGLLAPLIEWSWTPGNADAIQIMLTTTSGSFTWTGTFGPPAVLSFVDAGAGNTKFIRNPIPQDIWAMATNTAGGLTPSGAADQLKMSLIVAKGGVAYSAPTETWTIAPARLAGSVYYNSYGTQLVLNSNFTDHDGKQVGAAVLAITEGSTAPTVVAGAPSPCTSTSCTGSGCRVCHTAAAGGNLLVSQHGDNYYETSWYNLTKADGETAVSAQGLFAWPGLSADGTLALTDSADLAGGTPNMQLYAFPPPAADAGAGAMPIATNLTDIRGGTPAFSPDNKHVAFDFLGGTFASVTGNGTQLVALDFDSSTSQFSNVSVLAQVPSGKRAGFPSFFPTNDAVAFHYQIVNSNHEFNTWHGAQAQIWWSDLATGKASCLNALNGLEADGMTSYLPPSPYYCPPGSLCVQPDAGSGAYGPDPSDDTTLNYEPTVNPVSSGGYIWVVFTSRRAYGNVADTYPWLSDPRDYDNTLLENATTKKLWVAAIDVNASKNPGTDPSHPAFYLPAQELLAGNSRGFWVLNPCLADGASCQTGDQCCNGYCEPSGDGGALVCANTVPNNACSELEDKCTTASDCCDPTNLCVNGFCATGMAQ